MLLVGIRRARGRSPGQSKKCLFCAELVKVEAKAAEGATP